MSLGINKAAILWILPRSGVFLHNGITGVQLSISILPAVSISTVTGGNPYIMVFRISQSNSLWGSNLQDDLIAVAIAKSGYRLNFITVDFLSCWYRSIIQFFPAIDEIRFQREIKSIGNPLQLLPSHLMEFCNGLAIFLFLVNI